MTLLNIFYIIGIFFGFLFLVFNGMAFFGGDSDSSSDGLESDGDVDMDTGSGILSETITWRSLINFLTFFGWIGVFCLEQGYNAWVAVAWSTGISLVLTIAFASVMFLLRKLQAAPKDIDNFDVVGQPATVYLVIPGKDGKGKIQMSVRGALRTIDAISETGEKIDTNSQVIVTEFITDNLFKVKKAN